MIPSGNAPRSIWSQQSHAVNRYQLFGRPLSEKSVSRMLSRNLGGSPRIPLILASECPIRVTHFGWRRFLFGRLSSVTFEPGCKIDLCSFIDPDSFSISFRSVCRSGNPGSPHHICCVRI
jgi:hypothetical protein